MKVTVNYILRDYLEEYNDEQDYSYQKLYTEHEEYESVNDNYFNFNENDFFSNNDKPKRKRKKSSITTENKEKNVFVSGDTVKYKKKMAMVLIGPYEKNFKQYYEIQLMEDGSIITALATSLTK